MPVGGRCLGMTFRVQLFRLTVILTGSRCTSAALGWIKRGSEKERGGAELDAVLTWAQTHRESPNGDPGAWDELLGISRCLPILRHVSFSGQRQEGARASCR